MYTVQTCTAALAGKCLSGLLFAVDHQGQLLCSFCVFVLLTQMCWLSDGIWLTEEEKVVATPYITFQSLHRTPWLPQLLWEGQSTPFLFRDVVLDVLKISCQRIFSSSRFVCTWIWMMSEGVGWHQISSKRHGVLGGSPTPNAGISQGAWRIVSCPSHAAILPLSRTLHYLTIFLIFSEFLKHFLHDPLYLFHIMRQSHSGFSKTISVE